MLMVRGYDTLCRAERRGMRDRDIRGCLRQDLLRHFAHDPGSLVLDELDLCQGTSRVDMAVVNGWIHGYEIKSEQDTLERLPGQMDVYSRTLDYVSIVTNDRHLGAISALVPSWCGLTRASLESDEVRLDVVRPPQQNTGIDAEAIVQFLWRDEALGILASLGLDRGMASKPRRALWKNLSESVPLDELQSLVRTALKDRQGWRSDSLQT